MGQDDSPQAARRSAAERNLSRLTALAAGPAGLVIAAIASEGASGSERGLPPDGSAAAAIAQLPGVAVWAWPASAAADVIASDLASARGRLGDDTRVVLVMRPRARVLSPPLQGEVGASVEAVDAVPLVRAVGGLQEDELVRGVDVPWSEAAEAHVKKAGFLPPATGA